MSRFLSFKFDDGFYQGACTAAVILAPDFASFFLIAALIEDSGSLSYEPLFAGRDFGSIDKWRELAERGYDVQPHSIRHPHFMALAPDEAAAEIRQSIEFLRNIHSGPLIFGFPYNEMPDMDVASFDLCGAGFENATSDRPIHFHDLTAPIDPFRLRSWAVRERHYDAIVEQLGTVRDDTWTTLAFHSLDGEGHEPWTSDAFSSLVSTVRNQGFLIRPLRDMVQYCRLAPRKP